MSSFRATGIVPLNSDIFPEHLYSPAEVSHKSIENTDGSASNNSNEQPMTSSSQTSQSRAKTSSASQSRANETFRNEDIESDADEPSARQSRAKTSTASQRRVKTSSASQSRAKNLSARQSRAKTSSASQSHANEILRNEDIESDADEPSNRPSRLKTGEAGQKISNNPKISSAAKNSAKTSLPANNKSTNPVKIWPMCDKPVKSAMHATRKSQTCPKFLLPLTAKIRQFLR